MTNTEEILLQKRINQFNAYKSNSDKLKSSFIEKFDNYKQLYKSLLNSRLDEIPVIQNEFNSILKNGIEIEIENATDFNIFDIVKNIKTLEDETHTPFLRNLLDIKGSHMQGDLFFKLFIKKVFGFSDEQYKNSGFYPRNPSCFSISEQKQTYSQDFGYGFMDIIIDYYEPNYSFAICIENKIYHHDGDNQLTKYYLHLQQLDRKNKLLIYLTLDGKKPDYNSMDKDLFEKVYSNEKTLKLLSHYNDITEILIQSNKFVKADNVKFTINQYINTLYSI